MATCLWCVSRLFGDFSLGSKVTGLNVSPVPMVTMLWRVSLLYGRIYDVSLGSTVICLWWVSWFYGHGTIMSYMPTVCGHMSRMCTLFYDHVSMISWSTITPLWCVFSLCGRESMLCLLVYGYESIMCLLFYGHVPIGWHVSWLRLMSMMSLLALLWCVYSMMSLLTPRRCVCDVSPDSMVTCLWCVSWLHNDVSVMWLLTLWSRVHNVSPRSTVKCSWCVSCLCGHMSMICLLVLWSWVYDVSPGSMVTCIRFVSWLGHLSMMCLLALKWRVFDVCPGSMVTCLWWCAGSRRRRRTYCCWPSPRWRRGSRSRASDHQRHFYCHDRNQNK